MNDEILAGLLGSPAVVRRRLERGYTPAERWVVALEDGRSVFVKAAVNDLTAGWLRDEHRMYAALEARFMARMLGWADGDRPMLVLEDLSEATLATSVDRGASRIGPSNPPRGGEHASPNVATTRPNLGVARAGLARCS